MVALVPFFTWEGRVLLAGTGPTDYCDGLFTAGAATASDEALAMLAASADELGCEWIDLQQLPQYSPLLTARAPHGWQDQVDEGTVCPVTKLCGADGLGSVSARWRRNLAQSKRKLESIPGFHLRLASTSLFEGAACVIERLHARRWEQRGEAGVLSDALMRGFLRSLLPQLSAAALLRLHTLQIDSLIIAAVFVLHGHETAYFYISGFDPEWSRFSPGNVTVAAAMRQAASEGAREIHFLRGREPYKYHFGAEDRPTWRRVLNRAALRGPRMVDYRSLDKTC
jgi:CelD/BcsL family acetyltransferase involved in cellulose biosynthesis